MLEALKDFCTAHAPAVLAVGGGAIGFALGVILFRTNFCAMGAISDIHSFGDWRRMRAWVLASAVALLGTQTLAAAGVVDLGKSMYLATPFDWFGNMVGGFLFGVGMIYAGGCASKNLVRAGSGDLRSLVVLLVLGLFAYMTLGGLLGPLRAAISARTSPVVAGIVPAASAIDQMLSVATGLAPARATALTIALIAGSALAFCFKDGAFRGSARYVLSGVGVGLCVIAGWAVTGLAFDELAPRPSAPISLTFVRPTGDTLEWLQRFTAGPIPGFGVASTLGLLIGAFAASFIAGKFRLTTFADSADTLRNMAGAALMGVGGILALGCTVGQALTGVSTLAAGSILTFVALIFGGMTGISRLERSLAT